VRNFLNTDAKHFKALEVKYIPGKAPTLLCFDADEEQIFQQDISNLDENGISTVLGVQGITIHTPKFVPVITPTSVCEAWRQTGNCDPDGEREPDSDKGCLKRIPAGSSGFCECVGGGVVKFTCDHSGFTCNEQCEQRPTDDGGEHEGVASDDSAPGGASDSSPSDEL